MTDKKTAAPMGSGAAADKQSRGAISNPIVLDDVAAAKSATVGANRLPILEVELKRAEAKLGRGEGLTAQAALEVGNALNEAKALLGHGKFTPWQVEHCSLNGRVARRCMLIAAAGLQIGHVSNLGVATAAKMAPTLRRMTPEQQEAAVKEVLDGANPVNIVRRDRRDRNTLKSAALPEGKFRVIYADPPWKYGTGDGNASAEVHYPTMPTVDICAMDVKALAADDAVLCLWATAPMLEDALQVIEAWGFKYKQYYIWHKNAGPCGHYHRCDAEMLLLATRGSCPLDIDTRESVVHYEARGRHSEKPEYYRQMIDRQWKHGPRVELFRRGDAPAGWKVWGNEAIVDRRAA